MEKTYVKWKQWFDTKFEKADNADHASEKNVNRFYRMTDKVLADRKFADEELEMMMYRLIDPVTGLLSVGQKITDWNEVLGKIGKVCVKQDGSLAICPDDPEAHDMRPLLLMRQDSLLLLLSILILHETAYKGIVDFVYDCLGHGKIKNTYTKCRADYLKEEGFDVTAAADHDLRNGIAHSAYMIDDTGGVLVAKASEEPPVARYDKSRWPPPKTRCYERQELINMFNKHRFLMADIIVGVVRWFHFNHGKYQLFDDRFFGSSERDAVREEALGQDGRLLQYA